VKTTDKAGVFLAMCLAIGWIPATAQDAGTQQAKSVAYNLDAQNYLPRSQPARVAFQGTELIATVKGEAKITTERGGIVIEAKFEGLVPPRQFGKELLTYVLWAVTPQGRAVNLGEVPAGAKSSVTATTALESFGLMVTAEPYFAVTDPGNVVVLTNVIGADAAEKTTVQTQLLPGGVYAAAQADSDDANSTNSSDLMQAANAVRIARAVGAEKDAAEIFGDAVLDLKRASDIDSGAKPDRRMETMFARLAVERAEDARRVSQRKQAAERQMKAALDARDAENQAMLNAERAETSKARAEAERAQAEADRAHADFAAAQASARAEEAAKATRVPAESRARLLAQLNAVLPTSDTARGLMMVLSDGLFEQGKASLRQNAQFSLARVSGILASYAGLKFQVEGYMDTGEPMALSQRLSDGRANAVRDFLVTQGLSADDILATGYGQSSPIADNATAAGRAQNRRVQVLVSGDTIAAAASAPAEVPAATGTSQPPAALP